MRIAYSFLLLSLAGCAPAEASDDQSDVGALANAPTKFVLASAGTSACVSGRAVDTPLAVGACDASPELTYDEATGAVRVSDHPDQCLDVRFENRSAGAEVILHPCHGHANQTWRVSKEIEHPAYLAPAVRIQAYASEAGGNLCLAAKNGRLLLDTCTDADASNWILDRRVGDRLVRRGNIMTALLTFGMLESAGDAERPMSERPTGLPDAAGQLAVQLVQRVTPKLAPGEAPRVLVMLDDANRGEQAGDAALVAQALQDLLARVEARLQVEMRASVEITVAKVKAIVEDEVQHVSITITEKRTVVRWLVQVALVVTVTKAKVELVDEPHGGVDIEGLRMSTRERPHVVWFSNPGQPINDARTVDALLRFAERGGGVVVQGDDAAHDTARLTGLALRGPDQEANGHTYCAQPWDNGTAKYPIHSSSLPIDGLVYTDDLDLAKLTDSKAQVLATSNPSCHGQQEQLPAIVLRSADE